ncbi:hypothetical protein BCON_0230g00030 [Botryotinia convoluta]|uniref:Uncharacterized protein n=1 Tax=Botryotinia convoluta TaxID=54673 RepID=A0A4Z1HPZ0_9HELO|nr:hypothetical protein BCON_0230g00030 [Botryotinia convoluta]
MAFARREGSLDVILTRSDKFRSQELLLPSWTLNWISSSCWESHIHVLERAEKIKRIANVDFGHEIRRLHNRSYDGKWLNLMGTQLDTVQDTAWTADPQMSLTSGHAFQQPNHLRVEETNYSKAQILNSLSICFLREDFESKDEIILGLFWYAFYCVQLKKVTKGILPPRDIESRSKHASEPFLMHGKTLHQWALYSKKEIWKKTALRPDSVVPNIRIIWVVLLSLALIFALLGVGHAVKTWYAGSFFSRSDNKAEILKKFATK